METTSGNEKSTVPVARRRVQFSLTELLAFTIYVSIILTLYHASTPDAQVRDDIFWMAALACGALLGIVVAALGRLRRFKRWAVLGFSLAIWTVLSALHFGYPEYVCWRCGARRLIYGGLIPRPIEDTWFSNRSERSNKISSLCGAECAHQHWKFTAANHIFGSRGFRERYDNMPVGIFEGGYPFLDIVDEIERIPDQAWRRAAVDAMGTPENRLKYVAMCVVVDLNFSRPGTAKEWDEWWEKNKMTFEVKTRTGEAMPIAQEVIGRMNQHSPAITHGATFALWDLPDLKIP